MGLSQSNWHRVVTEIAFCVGESLYSGGVSVGVRPRLAEAHFALASEGEAE